MSDSASPAPAITSRFDPVAVLFALGSPVRLPIVKLLADGKRRSVGDLAAAGDRGLDATCRHMKVLRAAGVVAGYQGHDRRFTIYEIPPTIRRENGVLDFGFCVIDLNKV